MQVIDARDMAEWMLSLGERRVAGTFNATGLDRPLTMSDLLEACRQAAGSDARWIWVDEAFLLEHKVGAWEEMPMWIPERTDDAPIGILQADIGRAVAAGLTFRPLLDTARDTLAWDAHAPGRSRAALGYAARPRNGAAARVGRARETGSVARPRPSGIVLGTAWSPRGTREGPR